MPDFFLVRRFSWLVVAAPLPGGGASGGVVSSLVAGVSLEGLGSLVAGVSFEGLGSLVAGVSFEGLGSLVAGISLDWLTAGASLELDWPATGVWLAGSGCFATGVSSLEAS